MKKRTSLLALGIILSSQILPIAAHADSLLPTTGLSAPPPSSMIADNNESKNEPVEETEDDESVDISETGNNDQVTEELEEQEVISSQDQIASTENEVVSPDSITEGTWGTAKVKLDEVTGTLTVNDGVIKGGNSGGDIPIGVLTGSVKHIVFENDVSFASDSSYLFKSFGYLETVTGNVDTSNVTDMSWMFHHHTTSLKYIDASSWDTSSVTNMSHMFNMCLILETVNTSGWDTSSVTNMSGMFSELRNVETLDVSGWDTSKVTNMSFLFSGTDNLKHIDVSGWDTSKVTNMSHMFYYTTNLSEIDVSGWDTSKVTNMSSMFVLYGDTQLDLSNWDTSSVTNMEDMFTVSKITQLDLSNWDTSSVTNMIMMFSSTNIVKLDLSNWDTSNVTDMESMFSRSKITQLDISNWDTSSVTNMRSAMNGVTSLNTLSLGTASLFDSTVALPNIDTSSGEYTGRWIDEETGVTYESSDDFMIGYDGSNPGTYVWEKKLQSLDAKDTTIYVGDTWNPESNFISATNSQGTQVAFEKITVEGEVDTSKVGVYPIVYSYAGLSIEINVTVDEGQESLVTKDSTIDVGTKWDAKDNFVSATDRDGNPLDIDDISVEGKVNTSKAGEYQVVYSWHAKDGAGNPTGFTITSEAIITVVAVDDEEDTTGGTSTETDSGTGIGTDDKTVPDAAQAKSMNHTSSKLPSTGEQSSIISMTLGGLMLLFAGGMALFGLKKIKKETK